MMRPCTFSSRAATSTYLVPQAVSSHGPLGQPRGRVLREALAHEAAKEVPHEGVGEFGLHLARALIDGEQGFIDEPHERWIMATSPPAGAAGFRDQRGELVDGG